MGKLVMLVGSVTQSDNHAVIMSHDSVFDLYVHVSCVFETPHDIKLFSHASLKMCHLLRYYLKGVVPTLSVITILN